jgi:RNA polymerase sigma-70 factor (ECF subfamily)
MSSGESTTPGLVARIRAGDRDACEELVHREYAAVYRFLLQLTSDSHAAADLTQETFRAAWQKLPQFNEHSSIASWLHRIAYNQFIDFYRRQRRERQLQGQMQTESCACDESLPWNAAAAGDSARYLLDAVERLPDNQRTLIILHYFEGLSLRETAEVVGEAIGTVKWRVHAALRTLRTLIDIETLQ